MGCAFCQGEIDLKTKIGRSDTCPGCGHDLRCCKQCKFYDPHAYNACREVSADRIVDKDRANFCDYYLFRDSPLGVVDKKKEAKMALDALFKK